MYDDHKTFEEIMAERQAADKAKIEKFEAEGYRFYTLNEIRKMSPDEIDANWERVHISLKKLSL